MGISPNVCVQVWFSEMEISVERGQLLAENEVPFSLLRSLCESLVRCRCHSSTLNSCASQSILGSWATRMLWIPLPRHSDEPGAGRLTWRSLLRSVGCLVVAVAVPLPFYVRLGAYYAFESDEMGTGWCWTVTRWGLTTTR